MYDYLEEVKELEIKKLSTKVAEIEASSNEENKNRSHTQSNKNTYSNIDNLVAENEENMNIINQQRKSLSFYKSKIENLESDNNKFSKLLRENEEEIAKLQFQLKKAGLEKEKISSITFFSFFFNYSNVLDYFY